MDRKTSSLRPQGRPAGYHVWSNLLFLHWRIDASLLKSLVPAELTIDTFDGSAWIGLVPFQMSDVRPWWSPPIWGISSFPETNVRTYVHHQGKDPGVWFFSLDAAKLLPVQLARWGWGLNYYWSQMAIQRAGEIITYESHRRRSPAHVKIKAKLQGPDPDGISVPNVEGARVARPDTLEHFLIERYLLYTVHRKWLYSGQVHHHPYRLHMAELLHLEQSILHANQLDLQTSPCHVRYSSQVQVEVFPLCRICPTTGADRTSQASTHV